MVTGRQNDCILAKPKLRSGNHSEVFIIDALAPQAEPRCLTGEFEGGCSDWTNSDMTNEQMIPAPVWSTDCQTLYILAAQRGSTRVYVVDRAGAGKQPPTLTPGNMHVLDFSIDQSRNTAAILIENPTHVAEIFVSSMSRLTTGSTPFKGQRATIKAHPATPHHSRPYGRDSPSKDGTSRIAPVNDTQRCSLR